MLWDGPGLERGAIDTPHAIAPLKHPVAAGYCTCTLGLEELHLAFKIYFKVFEIAIFLRVQR